MEENKENIPAQVPFFVHENTVMHLRAANKRMLIIVISLCILLAFTVANYTIRTENWLRTLQTITAQYVEVINGIQQQSH